MQEVVIHTPHFILVIYCLNQIRSLPVFCPQDAIPEVFVHVKLLNHGVYIAGASQVFQPRIPSRGSLLKLVAVDYFHAFDLLP